MTNSSEPEKSFSRRALLTATGAGAAGLALSKPAQTAASCTNPSSIKWDRDADVIVIGSGTGLAGALVTAASGQKVVVLEKGLAPGGNTGISGGVAWIPNNRVMLQEGIEDSRGEALRYLEHLAQGQADVELREAFVDNGADMAEFIEANSPIQWRVSKMMGAVADYHPEWPGALRRGRSIEPVMPAVSMAGGFLISGLLQGFENAGGELLLAHPARELVWQINEQGLREVLGVIATHKGSSIRIKANNGVLLASGGFEHNSLLKQHFLRGTSPFSLGVSTNTGDGLQMAMALGADLRNMNECWGICAYKGEADDFVTKGSAIGIMAQIEKRNPGSIVVNRYGERFHNEGADYDSTWRSYLEWENWGRVGYRNLPAFQLFDSTAREIYSIAGRTGNQPLPAWIRSADTLEQLADDLGIDRVGLTTTVQQFNKLARQGKDPAYHRGESVYDTYGADNPAVTLGPLEKGPFYGAEVTPADLGTCGGPRVNGRAQVQDVFGNTIRNLYASGNCAGIGSPGASYGGGGGTIGPALTFAYIAGKNLAHRL
ncbi:MAG: FAD-binding protein [Halieaceae bacterium]|jgi:3-oxosteroid 1-dehydrogenase|nr:FAD-binding protein [Halieaceae bacterium]